MVETKPATPPSRSVDEDPAFDSAMYEAHADDATTAYPAQTTVAPAAATPAADAYVAPSEPVADPDVHRRSPQRAAVAGAGAAVAYATPQPIFVQAPEPPRPRGNRGAAGAIGLLAALVLRRRSTSPRGSAFGLHQRRGRRRRHRSARRSPPSARGRCGCPSSSFFIAFWLLGAIINRGRWGVWVIFGLLVGVAAYVGHILGALFQAPFWMLTASEGAALVESQLLSPLAIAAFIIGRELTIWFGAWVAARGARVTELNIEAQREYERTLEAGPQLTRV